MVVMFLLCGFEVGLQTVECLLCRRRVARFDGAGKALIILVRLRIFAKRRASGTRSAAAEVLLKRGQRTGGRIEIARLQRAADGVEVLHGLTKVVLVRGVRIIRGGYAGDVAQNLFFHFVLV